MKREIIFKEGNNNHSFEVDEIVYNETKSGLINFLNEIMMASEQKKWVTK